MVHDPRVTSALARLGGVYRDPSRVDRDAASLLKSSVGTNLVPISATMVENTGSSSTVLVLQGTIAIHFRGNTYQLLTDMYLPAGYPQSPPVAYVRLASPQMYLKEGHKHVGPDGKIYLPYLHEWRPSTHNLIELVVAMSSVFSADPPVFTRSSTAPPPQVDHNAAARTQATSASIGTGTAASPNSAGLSAQIESIVAREAAEANAAAAAARRAQEEEDRQRRVAEEEERRRKEALQAQKQWEQSRTASARQEVALKIQKYCTEQSQKCQEQVQHDWRDQQRLATAKEKIELQTKTYQSQKEKLEKQTVAVEQATEDIEKWLEQHKANQQKESNGESLNESNSSADDNIDDCVIPATKVQAQMMDLSAENAAIADALYFLDKALYQGLLDCSTHLKQVRRLAKRQFLVRAHLIKIQQVLLNNNSSNNNLRSF